MTVKKKKNVLVAPSLLSADFGRLCDEIIAVKEAGADIIHLDIMDGHFVPNITIGPGVVSSLRGCTDLPFDCHLMIADPDRFIKAFADAGADMISVHVETAVHLHRSLALIHEQGVKAGAVLNPATPIETLRHVVDDLDYVLIMSVNPGFGGQNFIASSLEKVRDLKAFLARRKADILIEIDGGIGPGNAGDAVEAGADILVAGSAIFHSAAYRDVIAAMRTGNGGK